MIKFIEGPTCSGKTTFAKNLCSLMHYNLEVECIPEGNYNGDVIETQEKLFMSFLNQFDKLYRKDEIYVCDFSPLGCIPFTLALAKHTNDKVKKDALLNLAKDHNSIIDDRLIKWADKVVQIKFLNHTPDVLMDRLKSRNRAGDECWSYDFIKDLCVEYEKYFQFKNIWGD